MPSACSISSVRKRFIASSSVSGISSATKRSMSERSPSGIHRRVEADVARVERGERLHDVDRQSGELRQLFRARLAIELLAEDLGRLDDAREVGGAVERNADRAPLARERREDRLADPPHGVRDELDALVGIELPGGGEQADVAFADEIDEREAAVLVFLGDGDDEAQVALDELLEGVLVAGADLLGEVDLLGALEQRIGADLVEVLVEDVALGLVRRDPSGGRAAATTLEFGHVAVCLAQSARWSRHLSSGGQIETASRRLSRCIALRASTTIARARYVAPDRSERVRVTKALQNTGPCDFRQSQFVDTRYTRGYTWWFLAGAFVSAMDVVWDDGGVAQLGERLNGIQEVRGSIPLASMAWRRLRGEVASEQLRASKLPEECHGRAPGE